MRKIKIEIQKEVRKKPKPVLVEVAKDETGKEAWERMWRELKQGGASVSSTMRKKIREYLIERDEKKTAIATKGSQMALSF